MSARERMIRVYDRTMRGRYQRRYYDNSGYFNFGYWGTGAKSQREACDALVDWLVASAADTGGRILDVACGLGASTERLTQTYPPGMITAINISKKQIADARKRVPACDFQVMSATDMAFPDKSFDTVICVEAAFHFDTRDRFFKEAYRVLKPGGSLVLSDILFRPVSNALQEFWHIPSANRVSSIAEYRDRLAAAGFDSIDVTDATGFCVGGFSKNLAGWPGAERRAGRMRLARSLGAAPVCKLVAAYMARVCKTYLLVSARKPS
jgi:MPBQ/MSBQ methyltransferase